MARPKNVLFIMCDQLRWDYLSCYGHPHLETPNIDALAARGVRFDRAYVQSTICGPSRMSFYTGRYVSSHGSTWNGIPLKVGEMTMGDHLRPLGVRTALCGKTHMKADTEGMARLGIDPASEEGVLASECGFEPYEREDGLHPSARSYAKSDRYNAYLRGKGWTDDNPWETVANSGQDEDGAILNGWFMENADKPARVDKEDSETPYMTRRAMDFIDDAGDDPWCLHLSYIKPHWPYIVPAPYHALYGPETHTPVVRSDAEREEAHPVYEAFMEERVSRVFARPGVRERVLTAYMGLVRQIDDQIGVLLEFLAARNLLDSTMIVFTSDHGDYLGDHWLGEKEMFHEPSVRIPLIVCDPSPAADATRGSASDALVEAIDLAPTFVDYFGGGAIPHILEGKSLLPLLHGTRARLRDYAVSEYDYSMRNVRTYLGREDVSRCRLTMLFDGRWKYIHAEGYRPMLFDLETDPEEFRDRGGDPGCAEVIQRFERALLDWAMRTAQRTTTSDERVIRNTGSHKEVELGIYIGYWNESEVDADTP